MPFKSPLKPTTRATAYIHPHTSLPVGCELQDMFANKSTVKKNNGILNALFKATYRRKTPAACRGSVQDKTTVMHLT